MINTYSSSISIPTKVRYDFRLTQGAKLMYGELLSFCHDNHSKSFYVNNSYLYELSDLYGTHIRTILSWIKQLSECGYISYSNKFKKFSHTIDKRVFKII